MLPSLLLDVKAQIEKELRDYCDRILKLLDNTVLKRIISDENETYYYKLKADHNRYIHQFCVGERMPEHFTNIKYFYQQAFDLLEKTIITHPLKLDFMLYYANYYSEIGENKEEALNILNSIFEEGKKILDELNGKDYLLAIQKLQIIKENIEKINI